MFETKVCSFCGDRKPIEHFYKNSTMKSGRVNKCKVCITEGLKLNKAKGKSKPDPLKALTQENARLKAENKKLRNLLIKINGITMREIHDDQL